MTTPAGTDVGDQLLPGVPDEITLDHITSKVPWSVCCVLSSVTRGWRHAVRTRQVYDARVRAHSTEAHAVVRFPAVPASKVETFALYSLRDKFCFPQLPPIPTLSKGIPIWSQCVSLDGKLYVLGGQVEYSSDNSCRASGKVYEIDLAGQAQWNECASMNEPRLRFGCGVMHGKIYVFGGVNRSGYYPHEPAYGLACGSEVYDPKKNVWSVVRPMPALRIDHVVDTVGEDFVVHGGENCGPDTMRSFPLWQVHSSEETRNFLEIYNPAKDEWRVVKPFGKQGGEVLFVARGKFHSLNKKGIQVHDEEKNTWTHVHSSEPLFQPVIGRVDHVQGDINDVFFPVYGKNESAQAMLSAIQAVGDELFAILYQEGFETGFETGYSVVQSKGFTDETKEIVWQRTQFNLPGILNFEESIGLYPIRL